MEEITNLINTAQTAIKNLENFIFANKKEKYVNIKTITDYMASQIEAAEMTMELHLEEGYEEAKSNLNTIISKCNELVELYQIKDNFIVVVDENGEVVTHEANHMTIQISTEFPVMEDSAQSIPIEPMEATSSLPEEYQAFAPEIKEAPELVAQEAIIESPIPEISILDDTVAQSQVTDYSQDLDVAAVDAFLGGANQENVLKL